MCMSLPGVLISVEVLLSIVEVLLSIRAGFLIKLLLPIIVLLLIRVLTPRSVTCVIVSTYNYE